MKQVCRSILVVIAAVMISLSCLTIGGCKKKEKTPMQETMEKAGKTMEQTGEDMQKAADDMQK